MELANLIHFILIGVESIFLLSKLSIKISIKCKAKAKAKAAEKKDYELYKKWKKETEKINNDGKQK